MSETIEARTYNVRRASSARRSSSAIIDVADPFRAVTPMQFYGGFEERIISGGSYWTPRKLVGSVTALLLADWDSVSATAAIPTAQMECFTSDSWLRWSEDSNAALLKGAAEIKAGPSAAARLRVQRLAGIQAVLGLSTSDFAQVLGLSRPGLYKWLDVSADVKLQEASRERLAAVERVSKQWSERSTVPLSAVVHEPLADGRTVLSLLVAEQVDEAAVVHAFDELLAKLAARPKTRSQRLAEAGFTRRPSAKSLPPEE